MKRIQVGSAASAPVMWAPIGSLRSRPVQTAQVIRGEKPMNHASVNRSVVPVLPAR